MDHKNYFKISLAEYFIVISLVKIRVKNEIALLNKLYNDNKSKKITQVKLTDITQYSQFKISREGLNSIKKEVTHKEQWVSNWVHSEYEKLSKLDRIQVEDLKNKNLRELIFLSNAEQNPYKRFLILQEAIMVPVYYEDDKQILRERFEKQNLDKMSTLLGNSINSGKDMVKTTDRNLNYLTGSWRTPVRMAVISITIILPFSAIALPGILKTLEILTGYKEANVKAEGVANLGSGALAVKDAQTGQTGILIAGGLLFGALKNNAAFLYFNTLNQEALLFICVKTLNFLQMLSQKRDFDIYEREFSRFIQTKYEIEKHLATETVSKKQIKSLVTKINILHKTLLKCIEELPLKP